MRPNYLATATWLLQHVYIMLHYICCRPGPEPIEKHYSVTKLSSIRKSKTHSTTKVNVRESSSSANSAEPARQSTAGMLTYLTLYCCYISISFYCCYMSISFYCCYMSISFYCCYIYISFYCCYISISILSLFGVVTLY